MDRNANEAESTHEKMVTDDEPQFVEVEIKDQTDSYPYIHRVGGDFTPKLAEVGEGNVQHEHPDVTGVCELCRRFCENGHKIPESDLQALGPYEEEIEGALPGYMIDRDLYMLPDNVHVFDANAKLVLPGDLIFVNKPVKGYFAIYAGNLKAVSCHEETDYIVKTATLQRDIPIIKFNMSGCHCCKLFGPGVRVRRAEYHTDKESPSEERGRGGLNFAVWAAAGVTANYALNRGFTLLFPP